MTALRRDTEATIGIPVQSLSHWRAIQDHPSKVLVIRSEQSSQIRIHLLTFAVSSSSSDNIALTSSLSLSETTADYPRDGQPHDPTTAHPQSPAQKLPLTRSGPEPANPAPRPTQPHPSVPPPAHSPCTHTRLAQLRRHIRRPSKRRMLSRPPRGPAPPSPPPQTRRRHLPDRDAPQPPEEQRGNDDIEHSGGAEPVDGPRLERLGLGDARDGPACQRQMGREPQGRGAAGERRGDSLRARGAHAAEAGRGAEQHHEGDNGPARRVDVPAARVQVEVQQHSGRGQQDVEGRRQREGEVLDAGVRRGCLFFDDGGADGERESEAELDCLLERAWLWRPAEEVTGGQAGVVVPMSTPGSFACEGSKIIFHRHFERGVHCWAAAAGPMGCRHLYRACHRSGYSERSRGLGSRSDRDSNYPVTLTPSS
ncbi:hypothetical protein LTR50_002433 [Elasticomyces elasticus]|nr:hypothetical protein LTR50_002433 [Elasticomyces elasticus]